ncbi:MAG: phenylalanine--tRNA ligase subunit beta [Spirochaetales bacterium]|nr:phenylalanine--tRNA ligase subunit beta [Spirochaetales bacterium]
MPKIEVQERNFFSLLGRTLPREELEALLPSAKAELDDWLPGEVIKFELNDTNRPDLWSAPGLARQLRFRLEESLPEYPFFSRTGAAQEAGERVVEVDPGLREIRPYIAAFIATGVPISEHQLVDLIQAQEKLCGSFGRKRSTIAMGVYRADLMRFPVHYLAADPDATAFVPLDFSRKLTLRQILSEHPKGIEFGGIVASFQRFPYLADDHGETLSFPPIINSARLGAVEVGDSNHFVELTGTDMDTLLLACSIVACDMADMGYSILPVRVSYPYDTPYGREVVTPFYFQSPVSVDVGEAARMLGEPIGAAEAEACLRRAGNPVESSGNRLTVTPPPYRNDFLHPVDAIEEIMIGRGMDSFEPVWPEDFTVGRLAPMEELARQVRELVVGLGYQEMIYNYLGSRRDFIDRMNVSGEEIIEIANPMSESYELVRNSQLPNLLSTEAVSSRAAYPHKIFEVGKIARLDEQDNYGSVTLTALSFLYSDREVTFNEVNAHLASLFYYLGVEHSLEETEDPRFVPGRTGAILVGGKRIGIIGELHPEVLERWSIQMPCAVVELELDGILEG